MNGKVEAIFVLSVCLFVCNGVWTHCYYHHHHYYYHLHHHHSLSQLKTYTIISIIIDHCKGRETITLFSPLSHNSFTNYGDQLFNGVPKAIWEQYSVTTETFKHQLDRLLNTILDEPPTPGYPNTRISQHQDIPTPGYPNTAPNSLTDRRNNWEAKLPGHSGGPP